MDFTGIKSLEGIEVVEFNHDFYVEKFRDIGVAADVKNQYCLRLCAYVDLGLEVNKANIPFR
jgi:hypothetical protein